MRGALLGLAVMTLLLSACDPGSKNYSVEFYKLDFKVSQGAGGSVRITGYTDLGEHAEIDGLVTLSKDPKHALEQAIMSGSSRSPGSVPVDRHGKFTLVLSQALTNTCHNQPPCGPFPAGSYYLMMDARTPHGTGANPEISTYGDPRFVPQTHGFVGFPGIEMVKPVQLNAINIRVGNDGQQVNTSSG